MKQTLYPKTERIRPNKVVITEKLDGSNLGFFKLNGDLYIAQRNNIFNLSEEFDTKVLYKGLFDWLGENKKALEQSLIEGACIFGEWIGMGQLKYDFNDKFFMFAKANVGIEDDKIKPYNIYYDRDLFQYSFKEQQIPEFIKFVPVVSEITNVTIDILNKEYEDYCKLVNRNVEGFIVINHRKSIQKYVRMKNGKLSEHTYGN